MDMSTSVSGIFPILILMVTGTIILLGDSCLPSWRKSRSINLIVSLAGIGAAAVYAVRLMNDPDGYYNSLFSGVVSGDTFAQAMNLLLLTTAAIAVLLAYTYLENRNINLGEYYALVLLSTSGAMLMAAATELITLFVAIEILSVALYVLAGFARTDPRSMEASLKYFLLGAFASGFLLYGIALMYGGSGTANMPGTTLYAQLTQRLLDAQTPSAMLMAGLALTLVGLGFKAALVPFHMWTPDVYEGAPTSVTAYMAACAKIGAFAALLRLLNALAPISGYWIVAVQILAVLSMFGGNILAVVQDNVKRMLAYSSIAHAGYLLVAVSAATGGAASAHDIAFGAAIFYLLAYTLMTMGAFAVLIWLSRRGRDVQTLEDLKGLARTDPVAAYTMLIFMLSLGGIPPTMGFMGKWLIVNAALVAGQLWLAIALALASIISIFYYLKVVWVMCFQEPDSVARAPRAAPSAGVSISLLATGALSVLLGIVPGVVNALIEAARVSRP
jgi:NADH-quinone oxidoreductase subunit N